MRRNGWQLGILVAALSAALVGGASAQTRGRTAGAVHAAPAVRATAGNAEREGGAASAGGTVVTGSINLNTASSEELERLPGVGPAKAAAILALRQRMGRFQRIEDVLRVRGIGRATFRRLRSMMTLQGQTTLTEAHRARARSADDGADAALQAEAGAP